MSKVKGVVVVINPNTKQREYITSLRGQDGIISVTEDPYSYLPRGPAMLVKCDEQVGLEVKKQINKLRRSGRGCR